MEDFLSELVCEDYPCIPRVYRLVELRFNFKLSYCIYIAADRAKQIKTNAQVNEDPTEKLIRELQEENEKLKKMMVSGGKIDLTSEDTQGMTEAG